MSRRLRQRVTAVTLTNLLATHPRMPPVMDWKVGDECISATLIEGPRPSTLPERLVRWGQVLADALEGAHWTVDRHPGTEGCRLAVTGTYVGVRVTLGYNVNPAELDQVRHLDQVAVAEWLATIPAADTAAEPVAEVDT